MMVIVGIMLMLLGFVVFCVVFVFVVNDIFDGGLI